MSVTVGPSPGGVETGVEFLCGRSSGVERNLAKVEVVSSNLIARSIFLVTECDHLRRSRLDLHFYRLVRKVELVGG